MNSESSALCLFPLGLGNRSRNLLTMGADRLLSARLWTGQPATLSNSPPGPWLGSQTSHGNGTCALASLGFQTTNTDFLQPWRLEIVSDSLQSHGLQPARLLCPWDSLGKSTGVGCCALLQGIFETQGMNPHLRHWQVLYH